MRESIIQALVQVILLTSLGLELKDEDPFLIQVSDGLYRKIMGMPSLLRWAMSGLIVVFNVYGYFVAGRLFTRQNPLQRRRQVERWRHSVLGLCRRFIIFFEKMTLFIYFSLCPSKT